MSLISLGTAQPFSTFDAASDVIEIFARLDHLIAESLMVAFSVVMFLAGCHNIRDFCARVLANWIDTRRLHVLRNHSSASAYLKLAPAVNHPEYLRSPAEKQPTS